MAFPRINVLLAMGIALGITTITSQADIAPTEYIGYGIAPVEARGLRMMSAQVDIVWGNPCSLSATFVIDNQTAKPADIQLGFPVTKVFYFHISPKGFEQYNVPDKFSFSFDGVAVDSSAVTIDSHSANEPANSTWYRCRHVFSPGATQVVVKTNLPGSLDENLPYRNHLFYCIETGGSWEGTIGSEDVNIHFPSPVAKGQIIDAVPTGYQVDGNTIRWQFKNFKPQGQDHDVAIEYLRPDVISILAQARANQAQDPSNPACIFKLAKDLFALGPYKGYAPYPPSGLSKDEFVALLAKIKSDQDRAHFRSFYSMNDKGKYSESDEQWNKNGPETLRILNAMDYQPPNDRSSYVDEARSLIEKFLEDHPANAEAWNIYFANYYRFHFTGGPYEIADPKYYPKEIAELEKAIALCPQDPCLNLWQKVMTNPSFQAADAPDVVALNQQIKKQGSRDNDYGKIEYGYF